MANGREAPDAPRTTRQDGPEGPCAGRCREHCQGCLIPGALRAALDAIPGSAWILAPDDSVIGANAAAAADPRPVPPPGASVTLVSGLAGKPLRLVVDRPERDTKNLASGCAARWGLTNRQRDVLALVLHGLGNREIADRLGCSERTVEAHLAAAFVKTGVGSRAGLMALAFSFA